MAKKKTTVAPKASDATSQFNLQEIYRLIHLEQIPGFQMLKSERKYLNDYRAALRAEYATPVKAEEPEEPVKVEEKIEEPETVESI